MKCIVKVKSKTLHLEFTGLMLGDLADTYVHCTSILCNWSLIGFATAGGRELPQEAGENEKFHKREHYHMHGTNTW